MSQCKNREILSVLLVYVTGDSGPAVRGRNGVEVQRISRTWRELKREFVLKLFHRADFAVGFAVNN